MTIDPTRFLDVASRAARLAASVCARVQREDNQPGVASKARAEPVTIADYASQALILRALAHAFPHHAVLSEEDSAHLRAQITEQVAERIAALCSEALGETLSFKQVCHYIDWPGGTSDFCWAVDPIDGTKGFLRGDQYAVAIGLLHRGVPLAGVLACPNLDVEAQDPARGRGVLQLGAIGEGAFEEPLAGGTRHAIHVSRAHLPAQMRVLGSVESSHGDPALLDALVQDLRLGGDFVRVDSQVKYAVLARGGAEIYLRPRSRPDYRDHVWDHVAGCAIATAAGAVCTDQDGAALDFRHGRRLEANRGVLATHGLVHDQVVASLRRLASAAT